MAGGSTVVGDGGHAVICKRNTYFYDRLEYLIENDWKEKEEPKKIIRFFTQEVIAITRNIAKDFALDPKAESNLIIAAKNMTAITRLNRSPYGDATISSTMGVELFLKTKQLILENKVKTFLKDNNCEVVPVATLIKQTDSNEFDIDRSCVKTTSKYCLVVDQLLLKELKMRDQICLITHEIFRLIPQSFHNEKELRSLTMKYCSP